MKQYLKKMLLAMAVASCALVAQAQHTAVAYVDNAGWGGWAVKPTRKEAEAVALRECKEANPGKKCVIRYTVAISYATDPQSGRAGIYASEVSKADAQKNALKFCNAPGCKVDWTYSTPGFFAITKAMKGSDLVGFFMHHGADTADFAMKQALNNCMQRYDTRCEVMMMGAIKGDINPGEKAAAVTPQSCRPNTPTVRCSSQCTNGDCVVTYENGCKMRVQVQPQFNGSTWVYPPPSC